MKKIKKGWFTNENLLFRIWKFSKVLQKWYKHWNWKVKIAWIVFESSLQKIWKEGEIWMFTLEDREICKNCEYKEICAGECEKTIKGYDDEHIPHID